MIFFAIMYYGPWIALVILMLKKGIEGFLIWLIFVMGGVLIDALLLPVLGG